jgi:tellurite resistance protein
MGEKPADQDIDWVLMGMVAVAASDGGLDARETSLIQRVYQDQSGQAISADEVAQTAAALAKGNAIAAFAAASKTLDRRAKEDVIKAAYRVLLADNRIAGEERKKLKDIAAALKIPEIHFGAMLEDLAIWLAKQGS